MQQTYDALTLITFFLSLAGCVISVIGLFDARQSARVAWIHGNGARIIVAAGHVRQQGVMLTLQMIMLLSAVVTWQLPNVPLAMPLDILHLLVWRKALRALASLVLIGSAVLDWRDRRRVEAMMRRRDA